MADAVSKSGKGGSCPELRLVLIGGRGRSTRSKRSTGNLILGQNVFDTSSRTAQSTARQREVDGRLVTVVDTPGWWWGCPREDTPELDQIEIQNSVHLCPPGPHAFLLVIPVELNHPLRVTSSLKEHFTFFNADVLKHTIVLFTGLSSYREENIQRLIKVNPSVQQILQLCGNRKHFLHISDSADRTQVLELFRKIEELVTNNLNNPYSVDETQGIILTQKLQSFVENASKRSNKVQKKRQKLRALIKGGKNPPDHLKLVIVGPQWSGKSSAGNIILGKVAFDVNESWEDPRTTQCEIGHGVFAERKLTVVDSPGWFYLHTLHDTREMDKLEIENSVYMCPPGPHAVLLVFELGNAFTAKCQKLVQDHMSLFGDDIWKHTIILFTMGDWLGVKTVEERIESEKGLQWLVNKCENRYHVLNNLERNNREQVKVLLEKIEEMWAENDDPYYEVDQRRAAEMEILREDADKIAKKMKKIFERQSRVLKEIFKGERQSLGELRVVLLGQKGTGKSTAGNRILFMEKFEQLDPARIKEDIEDQRVSVKHQRDFDGVKVTVVEAPGWYKDTETPDWLKQEVHRSVSMCDPGPHAFLLVVPVSKSFTEKDLREFVELLKPFTERVWAHCMVLFTWGQWLGKHSIEDHIVREGKALQELLAKCDNRYHIFRLEDSDKRSPVKELLQKVTNISTRNRGCFSLKEEQNMLRFLPYPINQSMLTENWKKREQMLIDRVMRALVNEPEETEEPSVELAQSMDDFFIPDMSVGAMSEYGSILQLLRAHRNVSEWLRQPVKNSDVTSGISTSSAVSQEEEFCENPAFDPELLNIDPLPEKK